jgi:hypothetical protein
MRRSSESHSDETLRLASERQALREVRCRLSGLALSLSTQNVRRPATSLQRRLSSGVKTDAEGFIRSSYNATGGASKAMRRGNFTDRTPTRHSSRA